MTEILKGKPVADAIKADIVEKVNKLKDREVNPKLCVVRLGANPNDISYEKGILKNADKLGILTEVIEMEESSTTEDLLDLFDKLNANKEISGILLFRPLPRHIDENLIRNKIDPSKDVDCMNPYNLAKVFEGDFSSMVPATPMAAMKMLEHYGVELEGKNVLVINRSLVFGKPIAMMLLRKNATVTIAHSRTQNLEELTNKADVVIVAIGRMGSLDKKFFNEKSIIIDVGVSANSEGKVGGDANFDELEDYVNKITPVPGGVGSITTSLLFDQVVKAAEIQNK